MSKELIDYSALVDEAMHMIVKKSLMIFAVSETRGEHHFFISFITNFPGVALSTRLRNKFPDEMTIVLQYQFDDLLVADHKFSVMLSFDNIREKVEIPFKALTAFADPSVRFGLQFKHYEDEMDSFDPGLDEEEIVSIAAHEVEKHLNKNKTPPQNNVVSLDNFRKKK